MLNLKDQAEGLRVLLGKRGNKSFIILSALNPIDKNGVLLNISAAIIHSGESVNLIDANRNHDGISSILKNKSANAQAKTNHYLSVITPSIQSNANRIGITKVFSASEASENTHKPLNEILKLIEENTEKYTISFIDIDINDEITEHLEEITAGQVIVLVNNQENSIKKAYTLLKKLSTKISELKVNIVVNGSDQEESQLIQRNISLTASNYLSISIASLGNIIHDEDLAKASKIGKSVFEVFPKSPSIDIFNQIARNILSEPTITGKSHESLHENQQTIEVQ
jgi:MinD-like ATPase involved in chromosome partitioning or flagellar assembly